MCFRISVVFFFLMISQTSFAVKCENLILDDFNFSYEGNEVQVSLRDETKQRLDAEFVKNKNSTNIAGVIQVKNNEKVLCFEKEIDIPPIKLCSDANNDIAPWRFVTYGETDILSVVALTATVEDTAVLYNSRICKTARVEGRSYVHNSYLEAGILIGADNDEVDGGVAEGPSVPPFPEIPKRINFNYFTVKLTNVEIIGNPIISGWKNGIFIRNYKITGSPMIFDEIALDGKNEIEKNKIDGNGTYSGESFLKIDNDVLAIIDEEDSLIPVITDDLVGDDNTIDGHYFIERKVENSKVSGSYSRMLNGELDVVSHISSHVSAFESSEFLGIGHIGGDVEAGSKIHGSYVEPISHGVLFKSGTIKNSSILRGAIYGENITIDNSEVNALSVDPIAYALQMDTVSLITTYVHGYGVFKNAQIYNSQLSGAPNITNAHLTLSNISCDARVSGTHTGLNAGCYDVITFLSNKQDMNLKVSNLIKRVRESFYAEAERIGKDQLRHEIQALYLLKKIKQLRGVR